MIEKELVNCSVIMLNILLKQYDEGKLSLEDLYKNSYTKYIFIKNNLDTVEHSLDKMLIEILLDTLEKELMYYPLPKAGA